MEPNPDLLDYDSASRRDAQAFATANLIVQLLKRSFFTSAPLLLILLFTPLTWTSALLCALAAGYLAEIALKRLLTGPDLD